MELSDNEKRDIQKYIETGKPYPVHFRYAHTPNPTIDTLTKIARALEVSVDDLIQK